MNPFEDANLAACAEEPIHIPGSIQPHGCLLVLSGADLRILQSSDNAMTLLGLAHTLENRSVAEVLGTPVEQALTQALHTHSLDQNPYLLGHFVCGQQRCDVVAHQHDGLTLLELEPIDAAQPSGFSAIYDLVRTFVASLQGAETLEELCQLAARELRRINGFGRSLVYRFDADGHGEVLAEDLAPGYDSYFGHRFPASDIPPQARELYRLNHFRLIARADYTPSRLLPPLNPLTQRPTDLSFAALRSVSPVHLEYMRNMGTQASMSVSIIVRGQLWGLISCHNAAPKHLPYMTRAACEHLAQILSLQVEAKEDRHEVVRRLELRRIVVALLAAIANGDEALFNLAGVPQELLSFGNAGGCAIVLGDHCQLVGATPDRHQVLALTQWLSARNDALFLTDRLPDLYSEAEQFKTVGAGIMAMSLSQVHRHFLIWFRPEVVQTLKWAGNPNKAVSQQDGEQRLHPRTSFETWRQVVEGRSLAWRPSDEQIAQEFRNALLGVVLKQAEEMVELASELGRINKELESFSYSVSHDLRAPLRHIAGYADLLSENEGNVLSERGQRFLGNIKTSARFAGTLVDDLLTFSQMGRAGLKITVVDVDELVRNIVRAMSMELGERSIEWSFENLPTVHADAVFMQVAMQNLLSNAVKYTKDRRPARIKVSGERTHDSHVIRVADNGVGFNMKYVDKLFGVFQRLHAVEEFEGTGIGLANVRRVMERHGGSVAAEGEIGKGAVFSISLPIVVPTDISNGRFHA